jgi:ATP-dependent DNA ligase
MPLFGHHATPEPPADPTAWRPQQFGRGGRTFKDAIIEPSWGGVRVLVAFGDGKTRLTDEDGVDCTEEFAEVAASITASALATELILDGFLSIEPTQDFTGKIAPEIEAPKAGRLMAQMIVGDRLARTPLPQRKLDPDRPVAFVAVDLLSIDGTRLLDIPLLERKRLLDGALKPVELVRITPFVRPPIGSFVSTWRSIGFYAMVYKEANSRYTPSVRNDEWSIVQMPPLR